MWLTKYLAIVFAKAFGRPFPDDPATFIDSLVFYIPIHKYITSIISMIYYIFVVRLWGTCYGNDYRGQQDMSRVQGWRNLRRQRPKLEDGENKIYSCQRGRFDDARKLKTTIPKYN